MKNFYLTIGVNVQARDESHARQMGDDITDYIGGAHYDNGADASVESVEG